MNHRYALLPVAVLAISLAGCKEEKKSAAGPAPATAPVREAAEQSIRTDAAKGARPQFRGVQVYAGAMAGRMAVCGQVSPFADNANLFVPFVSVVTPGKDKMVRYQVENRIATTTTEASRVYIATVDNCYEGGGPAPGPSQSVPSMPPLPDSIPDPLAAATPPAVTQGTPAAAKLPAVIVPAGGSVTMRQNGNLHSDPKGPSVRVVSSGTALRVFGQAAGGWYQVGDSAPWGWVHESMLDRH